MLGGTQEGNSKYPMLHNSASGPEVGLPGRISAGFESGPHQNSPIGRPNAGWRADFEAFPISRNPVRKPDLRPGKTIA